MLRVILATPHPVVVLLPVSVLDDEKRIIIEPCEPFDTAVVLNDLDAVAFNATITRDSPAVFDSLQMRIEGNAVVIEPV